MKGIETRKVERVKTTLVYLKDGESYLGEYDIKSVGYWRMIGKEYKAKYLYKGFRYFKEVKTQVVVFSNKNWTNKERTRRKANGFLYIKTYKV